MDKDFIGVQTQLREEYAALVDLPCVPSRQDYERFKLWIVWSDGCDVDGRFLGFCPLHDMAREVEGSAMFDFTKGMFWCTADPNCLGGRRAMSLTNLVMAVADRQLQR